MKRGLKLAMRLCMFARHFVCVHHKSVQIVSFCGQETTFLLEQVLFISFNKLRRYS